VHRILYPAAIGLVLAWGLSDGKAAGKPAPKDEGGCGNHGTAVHFVDTPSEAARQAKKEHKLVFVLHVSGLFEDPKLT
jgi:hypothetical protein